ncbi:ThiF family adenylyltransferase [Saccharothrix sp. S26]|uniref:ThiF family adenylyltransferase n=1 Tax=Saccharothrix sp. S26 TaxID=2907215 RepID=UPI001F2EADC6|nr:ThiF family adenylyltransferase [Saccharothrix sp. S26]MCE6995337.1 ThiF family adenylyltransferase [Saccharothrix sp. S26]
MWALLVLLDGTRTVGQVAAALVHRFPERPESDVRDAVDELYRAGHLYDADAVGAGEPLDERYATTRALWRCMDRTPRPDGGDVQELVRQARVALIGVGGVGCAAAQALTRCGVGGLHLVDPDVVERSNLGHQGLYTRRDLGTPKVIAARRRLRAHNDDVEITVERAPVEGPERLRRLAADHDVLVMAADTPAAIRDWTNEACLATGTPWTYGGYHGPLVQVGAYLPGAGPCYRCARAGDAEPPITAWPGKSPAVHAASSVSAGYAGLTVAHLALSLLTGVPALPHHNEYRLNLVTWRSEIVEAPSAGCPACR